MSMAFWLEWARRFRWQLGTISALTLLSSLATLAVPWLAAQALGSLMTGLDTAPDLGETLVILVLMLALLTGLNIAAAIQSERASSRILTDLRKRMYDHVQIMPLSFHDEQRSGDMLALISFEVSNLSDFLASTIANAPAILLTTLGAIAILYWLDPVMALIVPLLVPVFAAMIRLTGRQLRGLSGQVRAAEVELVAIAERDLEILPAIKAFASEEHHRAAFAKAAENARKLVVRQAQLKAFISPVVGFVAALTAIGVLVIGSGQLSGETSSPAEIFAFLLYAALLTRPAGALANMYSSYQMARGTLARLEAVLAYGPEAGHDSGEKIARAKGAIDFEGVSFAYPERSRVLEDLNLSIAAGETLAITGENGVGKSTLVRLLLRFYEPSSGRITLDGTDIAQFQVQEFRRQFGYVPQRALLFNGSIADNIAFGQQTDDRKKAIQKAVSLAQVDRFLDGLPDGLDTQIGDHGVKLSGGQRQRIALARALFRDPPIMILDEATSMYDQKSEAAFVEECIDLLEDRTVVLITHRPASLSLADRIIKLEPGQVEQIKNEAR